MKKYSIALTVSLILFTACKEKKAAHSEEDETKVSPVEGQVQAPKTYAEISIAQGGEWKERVYEGGMSFKNVDVFKLPKSHTDHSGYIRYEGPGWESSKVGYRLYLDWRNAIDIFGKVTDSLILDQVGQNGLGSYHEEQFWGQDILKVGQALGLGSYGRIEADSVHHFQNVDSTFVKIQNLDDRSSVLVDYFGWESANTKINLSVDLSIESDSRMTKVALQTSSDVTGLVTGIVKFDGVDLIENDATEGDWAYIATYGEQTLVPDDLGMVIFYKKSQAETVVDGTFDHLIQFKPTPNPITYYFAAAWEKEKNGIATKEAFLTYVKGKLNELNKGILDATIQ